MTNHVRQAELELKARENSLGRSLRLYRKATDRGRDSETPGGLSILKKNIAPLSLAIAEWMVDEEAKGRASYHQADFFRLCGSMDPAALAYIAIRVALDCGAKQKLRSTTAYAIGRAIEDEARAEAHEVADPILHAHIMKVWRRRGASPEAGRTHLAYSSVKDDIPLPTWTRTERLGVGGTLLMFIYDVVGVIMEELRSSSSSRHANVHVVLAPGIREWLDDRAISAGLTTPLFLPTVLPPLKWTGLRNGGYHTTALARSLVVKKTFQPHVEALRTANMGTTYAALNAIQETAWKINTPVVEAMRQAWDKGLPLTCLPSREDLPVPSHPGDRASEEAVNDWKKEARRIYETNATSRGKRFSLEQAIRLSQDLADDQRLYFPHQLDFRGRVYAMPQGVNPQGPDTAKASLTFADALPIDGAGHWWLMIHGSNTYGNDKVSFTDRHRWGEAHLERALATAADPFADLWWTEADSPWQFLAWCYEVAEAKRTGLSSLPIGMDGSCNGLQHFSAMLRDPIGGAATNLIPSALPQDIYQRVADRTMELLRVRYTETQDWMCRSWLDFGIDRKITKRPVMVLPYGGTRRSCMEYVRDAVREKIANGVDNPFGTELPRACALLSGLVWDAIGDVVVAARQAMVWLQGVARLAAAEQRPVTWVTPAGFPVHHEYREVTKRKVKTRLRGSLTYFLINDETDTLNRSKMALALSPNFVHSMDAAALALTVEAAHAAGITSFSMIHDNYGTHAANADRLGAILRDQFVRMYEQNDVLAQLRDHMGSILQAPIPAPPSMGVLDLSAVRESPYFFA